MDGLRDMRAPSKVLTGSGSAKPSQPFLEFRSQAPAGSSGLALSSGTLSTGRAQAWQRDEFMLPAHLARQLRELARREGVTLSTVLATGWTALLARWSGLDDVSSTRDLLLRATATATSPCSGHGPTHAELLLSISEAGDRLAGALEYATEFCDRATVQQLIACVPVLLSGMAADIQKPIGRLPLLTDAERARVLHHFNDTYVELPRGQLIHELFEAQVHEAPEAVALLYEQQSVTYGELNRAANRLARRLRTRGVCPDQLVALCVERSIDMVVGMLAILKAGGAYVPLDPAYPTERLAYMLEDAAPRLLLTQKRLRTLLLSAPQQVILIDDEWGEPSDVDDANLASDVAEGNDRHLAYVIYTSGSTGKPKGAMNEHRGMVNRIHAQRDIEVFTPDDICCQKTSISFVDAVFEIFGALCNGVPLVIVPATVANDMAVIAALIARQGVTRLVTVPSLARAMLQDGQVMRNLAGLRSWTLSGEEVKPDLVSELQRQLPRCQFINQYGSSEVSSDAACYRIPSRNKGSVPIGQPVANVQVYILDRYCEPVPTGVIGEIHVAGVGVARGYHGRPELTAERFLPDPFSEHPRALMYRTGDLGRWRNDGLLECLGRSDNQVKIRGFRVEPGEIEARILRHADVRETVVIGREDEPGDKCLVAYLTLRGRNTSVPTVAALRSELKSMLPEYMVPAAFVVLDQLPRTPNGKLDRRALPTPSRDAYAATPYEVPQGENEEALAAIWRQLLRMEKVSRHDNFFELGGHSLMIVQMKEELRWARLSAEVRNIFASPTLAHLARTLTPIVDQMLAVPGNQIPPGCGTITPEMLPLVILEPADIERIGQAVPGGALNIQDIYPLAPLQEGILFHHLMDQQERRDTYVVATVLSFTSRERASDLIAALQRVIDRHDILRTAVLWEDLPQPVQVVYRSAVLPVREIALDCDPTVQIEAWTDPVGQRLDLRRAPLMRMEIATDARDQRCYALLQMHHIVQDDESLRILISEVVAQLQGRGSTLPAPLPYRDHIAQVLAHARASDAEEFFRQTLSGIDEPTAPFGLLNGHGSGDRIGDARRQLEPSLSERLRIQARRLNVSAATLFHCAWGLVVARTSARDDVVFGSVLSGRLQSSSGAQRIMGMFINTLPLRLQLRDMTARQLVGHAHQRLSELLAHEQASLALAQRSSGISRSTPLFSSILNYRHGTADSGAGWAQARGVQVLGHHERTNYPITLSVDDMDEGFMLMAQTDRRVDPRRMADYLEMAMLSLVHALEQAPETSALTLQVLPDVERHQVVYGFNATDRPYPRDKLIHELFEEQERRTPDTMALLCGDQHLTYAELNSRANQLARYLIGRGIGPDGLVGVCLERSVEMVVGLLAVLKAGGAYLPLDPNYPAGRLQYMLEDAAPQVVLTHKDLRAALPESKAEAIILSTTLQEISGYPDDNLVVAERGVAPENLVYVIYTSGSTGRPKGTAMSHGAMVNLMEWHRENLPIHEGARVVQFAALSFDVAFQEIFSTLSAGATLVLLSDWVRRDTRALTHFLSDQRIARLFVPPLMLQSLAEYVHARQGAPLSLAEVITAGEQLRISAEIADFFANCGTCRLHNHYGPTETHVVTALSLHPEAQQWPVLPSIGRPVSNTQIYILNEQRQPVPIGVPGEIYIGGAGVARGYLGRSELTAQRFIQSPFDQRVGARLYRTGDMGRWQPNGEIEYLGRNDDQVKIRGFRIELGEIEAQLTQLPQVKDAVVVAREDGTGEKRLVAYVTAHQGCATTVEHMRAHLGAALPQHMIPSAFVLLESLPLSPNGKLDRRALPAPELGAYAKETYEAPNGDIEVAVARIWQKILRVERVGRRDNFFELGGHSLLATRVITHISHVLEVDLPLRVVFERPTVEALSCCILQEIAAELSLEAS